jgi:hypothetical protein
MDLIQKTRQLAQLILEIEVPASLLPALFIVSAS